MTHSRGTRLWSRAYSQRAPHHQRQKPLIRDRTSAEANSRWGFARARGGPQLRTKGWKATTARRYLFRRNEVVFRAEVRVGLEILSLKTLRIADLTAA
jgi:hypothetical protein